MVMKMSSDIVSYEKEPDSLENQDIEKTIHSLEKDKTQENIEKLLWQLSSKLSDHGAFLIPVLDSEAMEDPSKDLFRLDKFSLDQTEPKKRGRMAMPRKVELIQGGEAYTAFTSREELDKGESTDYTVIPMKDYLELALLDEDCIGIVINPWDVSVLLDKRLIMMILKDQIHRVEKDEIVLMQGDIADADAEAIVNATNTALEETGGVSATVFEKAGPELKEVLQEIGGIETGKAVVTPGFGVRAKYIIHTAGPVWMDSDRETEEKQLASCYVEILDAARAHGIHSVAIPAISTGIFHYPAAEAAPVALFSISKWLSDHPDYPMKVILVAHDKDTFEIYCDLLDVHAERPLN